MWRRVKIQPQVSSESRPKIPLPRRFETTPVQAQAVVEPPAAAAPALPETIVPATVPAQNPAAATRTALIPDLVVPARAAEPPAAQVEIPAEGFPEVSIPAPEPVDTPLITDAASAQSTAPASSPTAEPAALTPAAQPAPMPEPVNQALKTLSANPAVVTDTASTSIPESNPSRSRSPAPKR